MIKLVFCVFDNILFPCGVPPLPPPYYGLFYKADFRLTLSAFQKRVELKYSTFSLLIWCKPILGQLVFSKTLAKLLFSIIVKKYCFFFIFIGSKKNPSLRKRMENLFDILSLSFFNRDQFF